ncbi:F-box/kelch-repeat protein-like protein isoform X1 [Tanacetum coccineum]
MVVLDVVEEILSRLLVKDLLLCKSICKSWYSLISSPSFVETHCKFMCNKEDIYTRRIAIRIPRDWGSYQIWRMGGSSNGLAQPPVDFHGHAQCMGFGYDSSTDDYKVFTAVCNGYITLVHILSLKSNIWKLCGQINYRSFPKRGILFNGVLHWFWYTRDKKVSIVSFDLAKEEFREIPQPDTRYVWNYYYSLGIIEGSLCIFVKLRYPINNHQCNIWVMKNHNRKPSWERLPITNYCEMKDHAIHYMPKDSKEYRKMPPPTYFCDDNIQLSRSKEHISSPMFVQTLVSPYVKMMDRKDLFETKAKGRSDGKAKEKILVLIPETTFVGVESRVLIPETTFVGVESRVLIPEMTFVGVESRVLIPETTVWDTLVILRILCPSFRDFAARTAGEY